MADRVRKINYCYITMPTRAGNGAKVLGALKDAGINMLSFSGFPNGKGKAQLDVVAEDLVSVRATARKNGWPVSATKKGFLMRGQDRPGAAFGHFQKLADKKINVTAAEAVSAGGGRYGMILWVKPKDYARAARALGAK